MAQVTIYPAIIDLIHLALKSVNSQKSQKFLFLLLVKAIASAIEKLVQKCLDAKGQNVKQWEQEIDAIAARLYELSEDEMKTIRGEK
jgi:hypothetical protein